MVTLALTEQIEKKNAFDKGSSLYQPNENTFYKR